MSIARRMFPSRLEVEEMGRILQRRALGEGKLHDILVGFASADDAVVRPDRGRFCDRPSRTANNANRYESAHDRRICSKKFGCATNCQLGICPIAANNSDLRSVKFKRLVTFMSQQCNDGSIWQVFAVDLNHAVVYFCGGD